MRTLLPPVRLRWFEHLTSTNDWAKTHVEEWLLDGITEVRADAQSRGRGQYGRTWFSPAGCNLYVSLCFWTTLSLHQLGQIPIAMAEVIVRTLQTYGLSPQIKPPNDVLVDSKKIAGILCETIEHGGQRGVVCGYGLNINMPPELLQQVDQSATSLLVETGIVHPREQLADQVRAAFLELGWIVTHRF